MEPYEFVIANNEPSLVIEAFVSDKSFKETVDYPSDGRYFAVKSREFTKKKEFEELTNEVKRHKELLMPHRSI